MFDSSVETTTAAVAYIRPRALEAGVLLKEVVDDVAAFEEGREFPTYLLDALGFAWNAALGAREDLLGLAVEQETTIRLRGGYMRVASSAVEVLEGAAAALRPCLWPVVDWPEPEARAAVEALLDKVRRALELSVDLAQVAAEQLPPAEVDRHPPRETDPAKIRTEEAFLRERAEREKNQGE